jgi:hypothetical protein
MQLLHSQRKVAQLTSPATIDIAGNPIVRLLPQCAATEGCSFDRRVCGGHSGFVLLLRRVAATREGLLSAELWNVACRKSAEH